MFRDQTSLAANPDLWATIERALRESRYFILLASPEAARSEWVGREVAFWQEHRDRGTFLIVLTGGTISWDTQAGDFDWDRTDALPGRLRGWFSREPLWVDLTPQAVPAGQLSMRHARFRDAVATVAAAIHGLGKDQIDSEDARQHRRAALIGRTAVAVLTALTVALAAITAVAFAQRDTAIAERDAAAAAALAAQSEATGDGDPVLARLEAVAAWRLRPSPSTEHAMLNAAALRPWDAVLRTAQGAAAHSVAFSPGGKLLAAGTDDGTQLWDPATHTLITTLPVASDDQVGSVAFSPDGKLLAVGTQTGVTQVWDIKTRMLAARLQASDHFTSVWSVAFSPDSRLLAASTSRNDSSGNGVIQLWDTVTRRTTELNVGDNVILHSVAFSPDGSLLAVADDTAIQLWNTARLGNTAGRAPVATFPAGDGSGFNSVAFSPHGSLMAASTHRGAVQLWNTSTRHPAGIFRISTLPAGAVNSVAFDPGGDVLAAATGNGAELSDLAVESAAQHPWATLAAGTSTSQVSSLAFRPGGTLIAAGTTPTNFQDAGTIRLWDTATPQHVPVTLPVGAGNGVNSMAFSAGGKLLAVSTQSENHSAVGPSSWAIQLWNTATRRRAGILQGAGFPMALSPASMLLAAPDLASTDRLAQLWNLAAGKPAVAFATAGSTAAFTPDGRVLAVEDGSQIKLLDVGTGQQFGTLPALPGNGSTLPSALAVSPAGTQLAASAGGNEIQLWNVPYLENTASYLCEMADQPFPRATWDQYARGVPYMPTCP